jgi:hypothetical protein
MPFWKKNLYSENFVFFILDIFHVLVLILIKKSRLCYTTEIKGKNRSREYMC